MELKVLGRLIITNVKLSVMEGEEDEEEEGVRATYDSRLYCHFEAISPFGGEFAYFLRRSYHENSLSIQVLVWLTN